LANLDNRIVERDHDKFNKVMAGMSVKATKWWFDEMKWELIFLKTRQEIQGIDLDVREAYNHSVSGLTALTLKRKNFFLDGLDFDFDIGYIIGRYGLNDKASNRYDWDGNKLPAVSPYGGEQNNFPSDGRNRSNELTSKLNLGYTIDKHHGINLNVYFDRNSLHPNDSLMDKALGFQSNFPSKMKTLTTGLSYDLTLFDGRFQNAFTLKNFIFSSHSRSIDVFSVRAPEPVKVSKSYFGFSDAFRYKFTDDLMLKASFNSEVRIPTSEELIGNGYSILASPALKPERTSGVNLGMLYRHLKQDGGLVEIELNGFYNQLKDMIRFTPDMIPTMARYRNFGSVRTANFGAEFHKENLFGGKEQNTRFLFDASYVHTYYYDFEVSRYQDKKIPSALTMDAAIEHSFKNDQWVLTFKVKNLMDRHVVSEFNRPLPGRYIGVKVRYLLK